MRQISYFLICGLLLTSCQYDPYAHRYTTVEPTEKDVIGIYEFDIQTVDRTMDNNKFKENRPLIIIHTDKTFKIVGLPTFISEGPLNYKFNKQISVSGNWAIEAVGSVSSNGKSEKCWGLFLSTAPSGLQYAGLLGNEKPNGIIFGFGDPDSGCVIIFNKK